jgi:hypothetical protein
MKKQQNSNNQPKNPNQNQKPKPRNNNLQQKGQQISRVQRTQVTQPKLEVHENRVTIRHKEYVQGIAGTGSVFSIVSRLRLNPASETTFPWLSQIATSFETYRFKKLHFVSKPRCPTTTDGAIILSPDYDAADQAAQNEREVTMNADAVEDSCSKSIRIALRPERLNSAYKQHYTATDSRFSATKQDQKTLDCGFLSIAVVGSNVPFSKLWVEYECELFTPQIISPAMNQGGAGNNKTSGLAANTSNIFQDNALLTSLQELQPIIEVLPSTSFPGPNLFKFKQDWNGFIDTDYTGTVITAVGAPLINGSGANVTSTLSPLINSAQTGARKQHFVTALAGDLLGLSAASASTITGLVMNLGASSVI